MHWPENNFFGLGPRDESMPTQPTAQQQYPDNRRQNGTHQDAHLNLIDQMRRAGKGKVADEQAHGETDAAEQRDTVHLHPVAAFRQVRQA
jgi:hypothetical protein